MCEMISSVLASNLRCVFLFRITSASQGLLKEGGGLVGIEGGGLYNGASSVQGHQKSRPDRFGSI